MWRRTIILEDVAATWALGEALAACLAVGDVILLDGELGTGKSELARAIIRARAGALIEVPSPTFTLVQHYELPGLRLVHADLYRLRDPAEIQELDLEDAWSTGCLLVEWPDRAEMDWPPGSLRLRLEGPLRDPPVARRLTLESTRGWAERLAGVAWLAH